jgi:threonine/homoserine/homoserine lactone efflux protein
VNLNRLIINYILRHRKRALGMESEITIKEKNTKRMLKYFFIVHFVLDVSAAIPLFISPDAFLRFLGWTNVDPLASRLVAAALFGIGIESLLARNATLETFKGMLNLKIIWSFFAVAGIGISIYKGLFDNPFWIWMILFIFGAFNLIWIYWRIRAEQCKPAHVK